MAVPRPVPWRLAPRQATTLLTVVGNPGAARRAAARPRASANAKVSAAWRSLAQTQRQRRDCYPMVCAATAHGNRYDSGYKGCVPSYLLLPSRSPRPARRGWCGSSTAGADDAPGELRADELSLEVVRWARRPHLPAAGRHGGRSVRRDRSGGDHGTSRTRGDGQIAAQPSSTRAPSSSRALPSPSGAPIATGTLRRPAVPAAPSPKARPRGTQRLCVRR